MRRMARAAVVRMAEMEYRMQRIVSSSSYGQVRSSYHPCSDTSRDLKQTPSDWGGSDLIDINKIVFIRLMMYHLGSAMLHKRYSASELKCISFLN